MLRHQNNVFGNEELITLLNTVLDVDEWGIVVVNAKSIITFINKAYAGFFNKTPAEMLGKQIDEAYVNSDPSGLPRVLQTGRPEIGIIHYLSGRNVVANRFPIYNNGKVVGAVGKVIFKDLQEFQNIYKKVNKRAAAIKDINNSQPVKYNIDSIMGISPQIIDLKESIFKIAPRNSTVMIRGESGTGKELFAHAIHNASHRRNNSFIRLNCAAIPENLLESELFGYEEGAFTGAKKGGLKGKFELADKGTLFLDEIGDMSMNMQSKLLRALQEKEIEPLGGNATKNVDVRIIAATNVNLEEMIKYGKFRSDLYYRLNVVSLNIPGLRERKEDIDYLIGYFIEKYNAEFGLHVQRVTPELIDLFWRHSWPGNVRELENVIEQAFNFVEGNEITVEHIPRYLVNHITEEDQNSYKVEKEFTPAKENENENKDKIFDKQSLVEMMDYAEKDMIMEALKESNGNKAKAAQILGISRSGLYKKLMKYKLE